MSAFSFEQEGRSRIIRDRTGIIKLVLAFIALSFRNFDPVSVKAAHCAEEAAAALDVGI